MNTEISSQGSRQSIRLDGYDYAEEGAYFVTVCAERRVCLFGDISDGDMRLNASGDMIRDYWLKIPDKYPTVILDSFVIMPNHLHGILLFVGADPRVRPSENNEETSLGAHTGAPLQPPALGDVVRWFKTMTTNCYIHGVRELGWKPFPRKLWQRNYYDHIIRNVADANRIHAYIISNPAAWLDDENHPVHLN